MTFSARCSLLVLVALLGALSLFAAAPAQAQTTVWSATLTVKNYVTGSRWGCNNSSTGNECSSASVLTDDDITYDSVAYTFIVMVLSSDGSFSVLFDKAIPANFKAALTLHVDSNQFPLSTASFSNSDKQARWANSGLAWTAGDTISLSLQTPPPPTVSLSASPNPVQEGSAVTITATLSRALSSSVSIPVTITAGSAESGDYTVAATAVTVMAGNLEGSANLIQTTQDTDEDDETFTVALGTLPSSVTAGTPSSVTITISDDDKSYELRVVNTRPECGSEVTADTVRLLYALMLMPKPDAEVKIERRVYADTYDEWLDALPIEASGYSVQSTGNSVPDLRRTFPGFRGFEFRLKDTPGVTARCLWTFTDPVSPQPPPTRQPTNPPTSSPPTVSAPPTGGGPSPGGGAPSPEEPSDPTPDSPRCGETDRELERFYEALEGDDWDENENWNSREPLDQWYGVDTDDEGEVVSLRLSDNNLSGDMPTRELLCLKEQLKELALWGNDDLSGKVPEEFVLAVERAVLREIAEILNLNPEWFDNYEDPYDFEDWHEGVTTDDDGRVVELDLTGEGAIEEIPGISELRRLREIISSEDGGCALSPKDDSSAFSLFLLTLLVFAALGRKRAR